MSTPLCERVQTDTDFDICIYQTNLDPPRYAVTTYDFVGQKHFDVVKFDNYRDALTELFSRKKSYSVP